MKVCLLTSSFPRHAGDFFGSFLLDLGRELITRGVQLTVVAPHDADTPGTETLDGIRTRRFFYFFPRKMQRLCYGSGIPANISRNPWLVAQAPFLLLGFLVLGWRESRGCDLIHGQWSLAGLAGLVIARLRRIPFVLTMHGAEVFAGRGTILTRFVINHADYLITNSTFTLHRILAIARPRRYAVIPFGVSPAKSRPVSASAAARVREKWAISKHGPVILFVGRLVERKGIRSLLEALPDIIARHPDVSLVIAGVGSLRRQLEDRARQLAVESHVAFTGFVTEEELNALYRIATVFVLPAVHDPRGDTEGLGVVLLEAMLNGVPVIASRVGGITDIVSDSRDGLLVEPGNSAQLATAVNRLLADPVQRRILAEKGRRRVRTGFSWERIAQQTLQVYQAVGLRSNEEAAHG